MPIPQKFEWFEGNGPFPPGWYEWDEYVGCWDYMDPQPTDDPREVECEQD